MKDGAMKACFAIGAEVAVYAIYIFGHVAAGEPIPNGPVFVGVCTSIAALAGVVALGSVTKGGKG